MKLWIKLALRELSGNRKFSLFFILNFSIGLVGFIALNSFNFSIQNHLKNNLKEILTADIAVYSPRPLNQKELNTIDKVLGNERQESHQVTFFSMISGNNLSRLAMVIAIDNKFPLYGKLVMEKNGQNLEDNSLPIKDNSLPQKKPSLPFAWISRDLAVTLNVKTGDTVRIGNMDFMIEDIVISSPGNSVTPVELAPSIYIDISNIEETGLTGFGSRIRYARYYRILPETTTDQVLMAKTIELRNSLAALFDGEPLVNVYNSEDVNRNLGRLFGYFTGYMGLVAIVALFLAGIGTSYLFRGYLNARLKEMAILKTLGARRIDTYFLMTLQVMILGFFSTVLSVAFSFVLLPFFPKVLKGLIPVNFEIAANPESLILASFLGTLGSVIFCLPLFVRIHFLKPLILLQGSDRSAGMHVNKIITKNNLLKISAFLPVSITFWILAVGQTRSFERGTFFLLSFAGVMLITGLTGTFLLSGIRFFSNTGNPILKIAFRNLYRHKFSFISCFVTIAMGAFLINVIPQIKNGIQDEISRPEGMKIPGFFLIDIQPEQLNELEIFLKARGVALDNASPMVRGRINKVNGVGFYDRFGSKNKKNITEDQNREKSRLNAREEGAGQGRFRRREFNFSWREKLDVSETIVKGKPLEDTPWNFHDDKPLEISLEEGFAERFHLEIGDIMLFDIQGIPLEGRVVNFRKVRWNSFQPNFFILFQKGVLDDAPCTYLASVPQMPASEKMPLQNAMAGKFPNISVLDVNQTVEQLLDITDRLTFSINFMAWLAIVAGLVVLFSIVRYETRTRSMEINLLKVLGAGFNDIIKITFVEFGFMGFSASLFAVILSLGCSYGISWLFFGNLWSFRWEYSLFSIFSITVISLFTVYFASRSVIMQKPVVLLKSA
ncbi:ABC-type transporter, permease protein [Desulfamplus magnetovallimortis]|uniref:ABC-type transporter, permease protein n=1 Tax=Desulfamplus magnetovallimortis TaxID=1246637 RepID=A0A1W1HHS1_9BACT|nr:FtsX-like permease family protein [Desulfamplus magnetovallimortis]SLM31922.1 ABC-type transporter, permease protein [Desulfamplus magnetovallimortis]